MKKFVFILLLPFLVSWTTPKQDAEVNGINVMTFNIRYDNPEDSLNNWSYRKENAANAIRFYDVDILGTQEVLHNQLTDLKSLLPGYEALGVGRKDGKEKGEYSALWFKKNRFSLVKSGYFWLSQTPEIAGSLGWDGACERIATWAILKDKRTNKRVFVLNTHFDHIGTVARRESVKLILNRIYKISQGLPVIVTGDFNSEPSSSVVKSLTDSGNSRHLTDSRAVSPLIYGPAWSFHDFGKIPLKERSLIDYIFVRNEVKVLKYGVLAETNNSTFLSDHAPVLIRIAIK
ncbi:endonuclease/exonuclease/phosphatase family protein [uncultured Bacteroides sp.]|uniref:endonuclease/exonuclease/phosphatase family protein n=1 Tax=uncultured Bacteroides sp. TaxID=162156 RepID=UPI002AAA9EC2|nr:endonuclease/exonuclease/phosphatase family protein [uncultured Bacteroides sp.]